MKWMENILKDKLPCESPEIGFSCMVDVCPCDVCPEFRRFHARDAEVNRQVLEVNGRWV